MSVNFHTLAKVKKKESPFSASRLVGSVKDASTPSKGTCALSCGYKSSSVNCSVDSPSLQRHSSAQTFVINDQYAIGDDLIVAPVVVKGQKSRDVYLPK